MATNHPFGTEDNSSSSRETTNSHTSETLSRCPENPPSGNDLERVTCRLDRLRQPVQTHCGHLYCRGYMLRSIRDAGRVNNECLDGCQMPDHNETEVEELDSRFNFASRSSEGPHPTMNEDLTWESRALNVEQTGSEQQQTEIDALRSVVNELTDSCEEKQTEIDGLRSVVNELTDSCEQQQTEIDGLRSVVNELTDSCEQQQKEIDGLIAVVNELTDSCEQQQTESDGLRSVVNELTDSCEQQQTEVDELRGVVNEMTSSCEEKQTEINGLRRVINELKSKLRRKANGNRWTERDC